MAIAPFMTASSSRFQIRSTRDPTRLPLRRNHLRHPAHAGIARIEVVLLVHHPITGFDELPGADAHAVADGSENLAVTIHFQELAVLAARHPWLAVGVEIQRAHEISHLHRLEELARA